MNRIFLLALLVTTLPIAAQDSRPELVLQIGHMSRVTALAVSPDGQHLASGGMDRTAKIWDARSGTLRRSLPHPAHVLAVAFAGNDELLTAAADGAVRLWQVSSGRMNGISNGGRLEATAAAFTPDNKLAAFALSSNKIVVRDTSGGKTISNLDGHPTPILGLAFSPDGKTLASVSAAHREKPASPELARLAGGLRLWDVASGELLRTLRGHALSVRGVAWSPDGTRLASAGQSGNVLLWDTKTYKLLRQFNVSEGRGGALGLSFSADGSRLATGWRGGVQVWQTTREAAPLWKLDSDEPMPAVQFLPDGRVVAGGQEGTLQLLGASDGAVAATSSRVAPLLAARASADGQFIATGGGSGMISLWDAQRGELVRAWHGHAENVRDLAWSPDGKLLATAGNDAACRLWDMPSGRLHSTVGLFQGLATAVAFSRDGHTLAVGAAVEKGHEVVTLWNVEDAHLVATLKDTNGAVSSLAYGADGGLVAATWRGSSWGQVLAWDAGHKLVMREFLNGARAVALSPDGRRLAAAGALLDAEEDNQPDGDLVSKWSLTSQEKLGDATSAAPEARALDIAFGTDANSLATGSSDGAIRLWDAGEHPTLTMRGHAGPVVAVGFMRPQGAVFSAGRDGTVRLWDNASGAARATLLALPEEDEKSKPIGSLLSPDWLAVTPGGYYNCSPGAARFVHWHVGSESFPVAAFEGVFHRPAAVRAALAGAAASPPMPMQGQTGSAAVPDFTSGLAIPPQISIVSPQAGQAVGNSITVNMDATDANDLRAVQLLINGRPAASETVTGGAKPLESGGKALEMGAKALEMGAKALDTRVIPATHRFEWKLSLAAPLPPADEAALTVKAIATNREGLQGWDEIRLARNAAASATHGNLHVLSVGVSAYANRAYNLKYAAADATTFGGLWAAQRGRLFGKVDITTLTDARATSTAVLQAMQAVARDAGPDDVVAIFLSGHGVQAAENEFFFATQDVSLDHLSTTAVPWTAFQTALAGSKARRVVLFLDACHSGGALGGRQAGSESMAEQLAKGAGAVVFASSLGTQHSFELDELGHGAFTQALLEGVGQGKADLDAGAGKDGIINVEELLTYLRARVPQLTGGAQLPSCPLLRDFGEPFPLAKTG